MSRVPGHIFCVTNPCPVCDRDKYIAAKGIHFTYRSEMSKEAEKEMYRQYDEALASIYGIAPTPERTTPAIMNLTTSESEMNCLLCAAEKYSEMRKQAGKPTSIIDTIIERLKMSPKNHDLVFVQRIENKPAQCSADDCTNTAVRDGRCLIHAPKDPFV